MLFDFWQNFDGTTKNLNLSICMQIGVWGISMRHRMTYTAQATMRQNMTHILISFSSFHWILTGNRNGILFFSVQTKIAHLFRENGQQHMSTFTDSQSIRESANLCAQCTLSHYNLMRLHVEYCDGRRSIFINVCMNGSGFLLYQINFLNRKSLFSFTPETNSISKFELGLLFLW